ncbi:MAG: GSCFA domain-containing protein [Bacteroidetes bacterium]|nr:GSCFA domain-containing protein [Bacteroidota bacterium]
MNPRDLMIPFALTPLGIIKPESPLFFSGSCFGEVMSQAAQHAGFDTYYGPCGIVFNPLAMAEGFKRMLDEDFYSEDDLIQVGSLFHTHDHHSAFSGTDKAQVLHGINQQLMFGLEAMRKSEVLVLSFGTAWYYILVENGRIVSNNHRRPAADFVKELATSEGIVAVWESLLLRCRELNPQLKVCLAVSPVKYLRDGLVEHSRSKAVLISAVHALCEALPETYYFPSYELLVDVLRDYRWYAEDMAHPSRQAESIIWEAFSETWMDSNARKMILEVGQYRRLLAHKIRFPDTPEAISLQEQKENLNKQLMRAYPHLDTRKLGS